MSDASPVGHRHDPRPATAHPPACPPNALDELGRLEQLVEVAAADHPGRVEGRVGHSRLAGK